MRTKFKQWAVDYIKNEQNNQYSLGNFDLESFKNYINDKKTFIEIGPGKGQFILTLAAKFPDFNFIVCEINETISGICLKKIDESGLKNIRLVCGDFFKLGELMVQNHLQIPGIFLNFSDPWPKKRHEKRRLTSDGFMLVYSNILLLNSSIYFKSDNDDFSLYSLDQFKRFNFNVIKKDFDYNKLDNFDALTEFEEKFKESGIKIKRFVSQKTEKTITKVEELA
jgi:tRNA (guanine-N7-)-methyltransferase